MRTEVEDLVTGERFEWCPDVPAGLRRVAIRQGAPNSVKIAAGAVSARFAHIAEDSSGWMDNMRQTLVIFCALGIACSTDAATAPNSGAASVGVGAGGFGGSASCIPSPEVCDHLDNDCDDIIDNGFDGDCDDPLFDTDGDGLRDLWEVYGVDGIDLAAMGADPLRKDVFIHLNWMEDGSHSDRFSDEAIWRVQQAFLDAPVDNPDGSTGISLHFDAGPDSIMNPLTMETWGSLSRAQGVDHAAEFDPGTELEDSKLAGMPPPRLRVFRYGLAAHRLAPLNKLSPCSNQQVVYNGYGEPAQFAVTQGSDDSILINLGGFDPNVMDAVQESTLLMHEIGHTFGLGHGGPENLTNRKPNYLSVMNYSYSYRGLRLNGQYGTVDYSRVALDDLDENALDETAGMGPAEALSGYGFIRYCGEVDIYCLSDFADFTGQLIEEPDANGFIDWNCNGVIDTSIVSAELNLDLPHKELQGASDWDSLDFTGEGKIGGDAADVAAAAATAGAQIQSEPRLNDPLDRIAPLAYRVAIAGQGIVSTPNSLRFVVLNRGTRTDSFALQLHDPAGIVNPKDLPASIRLMPGTYRVLVLSVQRQHSGSVRLRAFSAGNANMAAEATTRVGP